MIKHYTKAFSLIEVLIFVTVFSLFFVLAATVVTTTLRITKENQNKITATHYAEELKEWLESEKESNWGGTTCTLPCTINAQSGFTERVSQTAAPVKTDFCFNDINLFSWPIKGTGTCYLDLDGKFRRIATFSATAVNNYVSEVGINITVDWKEGDTLKSVPLNATFSIWE